MPDSQQPDSKPLAQIDGNVPKHQNDPFNTAPAAGLKKKPSFGPNSLLNPKGGSKDNKPGQYVSPSDNIVSPASAKLNAFKEKRFAKATKPRTLFATTRTLTNSEEAFSPVSSKLKDVTSEEAADE